ncbi:MAG TPA: HDOD domain-containing protein [Steroidobacteraceae bacterium]|nr:HDOD domain-containing protein [Steroidobacteraceae bacterium]
MTTLQIFLLLLAVLALLLALIFGLFRVRRRQAPAPTTSPASQVGSTTQAPRTMSSPAVPSAHPEAVEEAAARHEVMHRMHVLALETGMPQTSSNEDLHEQLASAIRWALTRITEQANYAPRRPLLLPKLVAAMNDDDTSRRELAHIITSDPSLAGTLLKLANSPFYRVANEPIESLDRAIAVLGMEGMRSLVAAALMQPVFRIEGGGFPQFGDVLWQHTLSSATAAQAHATMIEHADPFAAQLLALMMGMAAIVVFRLTIDQYEQRHLSPLPRVVMTLLTTQTAPVARQVAASWQLTERMEVALADQTAPQGVGISALGRSLLVGRFIGALDVLHQRRILDDAAVYAALRTSGDSAEAYERIWMRRNERNRY